MRKFVIVLLAIGMALPLLLTAGAAQAQTGFTWVGEYYGNTTLSGAVEATRVDSAINFQYDTPTPAPNGRVERFSARWTAARELTAGTYRLTVRSDDGVRVYVDNALVIDEWFDQPYEPATQTTIDLAAGQHAFRVEYYNNTGPGAIRVDVDLLVPQTNALWVAEYYSNPNLIGPPVAERIENQIDYIWETSSPLPGTVPVDNFSARWTGSPDFAAGTYTFILNADDGARLYLDGALVIDRWVDSGYNPAYTYTTYLNAGQHAIRLEYYERTEAAAVRLVWQFASGPTAVPTVTPIAPTPTPVPTAVPTAVPVTPVTGTWTANYFNNAGLAGVAVYSESFSTTNLDLDWGSGSPGASVPVDNFSARISRTFAFSAGNVRFVARADDGVRLYVDNQVILNEWHVSSGRPYFVDYPMAAGNHTLTVEYYEASRLAALELYWVYTEPAAPGVGVNGQVDAFTLNVRRGPGTAYAVIDRVTRSQTYSITGRVTETTPDWYRINDRGITGWVSANWITVIGDINLVPLLTAQQAQPGQPALGVPTGLRISATVNLNVRSGPGTQYNIIDFLSAGQAADVVGRNAANTWWEINVGGGRGWVAAIYTTSSGNLNAVVPVTG